MRSFYGILMLVLTCAAILLFTEECHASEAIEMSSGQTVYVPVYSHIYSGNNEYPFYLAVTVSIRNVDPKNEITIFKTDYFDSDGALLKSYIKEPIRLKPLSSIRYIIKESDKSGGSGANFIISWEADGKINAPIIEAVMIGAKSQQGISFISRGRVIKEKQ